MPDYSITAILEPVPPGGLLGLLFLAIGIVFVHASLGTRPDALDPTVRGKMQVMSPVLLGAGMALIVVAVGLVFLI